MLEGSEMQEYIKKHRRDKKMRRCFPESSLPPSSLPPSIGRMPRAECTENSVMFNMSYTSKSRTANWFLDRSLEYQWYGCFLRACLSVSLSVCQFFYPSGSHLPLFSPAGLYSPSGQSGQWAACQSGRTRSPPFWNRARWVGTVTTLLCKEVSM